MYSKFRRGSGRGSRSGWAALALVAALAGLGADRPGAGRDAVPTLPPVVTAPDAPLAPAPDAGPVVPVSADQPAPPPLPPIPAVMPGKPELTPAAPVAPAADAPVVLGAPAARVYAINGLNFLGRTGFSEMVERIRGAGYADTRSGPWFRAYRFERDIRQLHREQPGTPVVVIGYSLGTYRARAVANRLTRDGIPVAMVGYVGGDYLRDTPSSSPPGARVVNVTGNGFLLSGRNLFFRGTDLTGADNRRLDVSHLDLPRQPQTAEALLDGLYASTGGLPVYGTVAALPSAPPAALAGSTADVLPPPRVESTRLFPMFTGSALRR